MEEKPITYKSHVLFPQIRKYIEFYESLTSLIFGRLSLGVSNMFFDTYLIGSTQSTLESIEMLLKEKKINDAYALMRKYYDATNLSIYVHLYLEENFSLEKWKVREVDDWLKGKARLPDGDKIYYYLKKSERLKPIREILKKKNYTKIRERCNDHMHYNYYFNVMLNNNSVNLERMSHLDTFSADLHQIFVRHLSYLFLIKDVYLMSTDYVDYMDVGETPPEGAQYFVAPFIQDMFNETFLPHDIELYDEIKKHTSMQLD